MVKCVVSGCPNRVDGSNHGVFNRTQKRFFKFPRDPTRVKVWSAALRQTEQNPSDQNSICEDHFSPEDVGSSEVSADAIPIMPPCSDGPSGMSDPWGTGPDEEEEQWGAGAEEEEEEEEERGGLPFNTKLAVPEPPHPDPPEQEPDLKAAPGNPTLSVQHRPPEPRISARTREDVSSPVSTRRFSDSFQQAPDGCSDSRTAIVSSKTRRRRVYDITNVSQGVRLVEKESVNRIRWIGGFPVSSYMGQNQNRAGTADSESVEETSDSSIRTCAQQLLSSTDDPQNSPSAYVTSEDSRTLDTFQNQTSMVVKAPDDTRSEVPTPTEDSIQVHSKGRTGPISVMTCDLGTEGGAREPGCFLTSEESRIKTAESHKGPKNVVQNS